MRLLVITSESSTRPSFLNRVPHHTPPAPPGPFENVFLAVLHTFPPKRHTVVPLYPQETGSKIPSAGLKPRATPHTLRCRHIRACDTASCVHRAQWGSGLHEQNAAIEKKSCGRSSVMRSLWLSCALDSPSHEDGRWRAGAEDEGAMPRGGASGRAAPADAWPGQHRALLCGTSHPPASGPTGFGAISK